MNQKMRCSRCVFKWTDQDLIEEDIENGISCECMEIVEETTQWEY